ncbi:hypothetical protein B0H19DRAFT_1068348, partial [Mycena capillaripes]
MVKNSKRNKKAQKKKVVTDDGKSMISNQPSLVQQLPPTARPPDQGTGPSLSTESENDSHEVTAPQASELASSLLSSLSLSASDNNPSNVSAWATGSRSTRSASSRGSQSESLGKAKHKTQGSGMSFVDTIIPPTPPVNMRELGMEDKASSVELSDTARRIRKAEKQKRSRDDSIESAEMHQAAALSLQEMQAENGDAGPMRRNVWDDDNLRAAYAVLARERQNSENSEGFQRRCAALQRNEALLRTVRVEEDRIYAADIQAQMAQVDADGELADTTAYVHNEIRRTHTFADRVILQKYRMAELAKLGIRKGRREESWQFGGYAGGIVTSKKLDTAMSPSNSTRESSAGNIRPFLSSPVSIGHRPAAESSRAPKQRGSEGGIPGGGSSSPGLSSGGESSSSNDDSEEKPSSSDPYISDGNSDSIWDLPDEVISEITVKAEANSRTALAAAGGVPPEGSSSSSDSDHKPDRPKGPSKTPRKNPNESERERKRRHHRNGRRKHHASAKEKDRLHLYEAGDPFLAGIPAKQQEKRKASLHAPFIQHYKAMLGNASPPSSIFDNNRMLKIPAPDKYNGSKDIKIFESHVSAIVQWMQIMGLGGPEHDEKRKGIHSFYLTGNAKEWYDTRVNGIQRPQKKWTHLQMILGLFDQFIDTACVQNATEQFWTTKFSPEMGVTGFYNELVTCAKRMVHRPDPYTFKNQFMGRLPADMVKFLIQRNITAEYCSTKAILRAAVNYEWQQSVSKRYAAARDRDRGAPTVKAPVVTKPREESGKERREAGEQIRREHESGQQIRREDIKRKVFRFMKRDGALNQSRPAVRDGGEALKSGVERGKNAATPNLFAQREIVDDNSETEEAGSSNQIRTGAPSEQLRNAQEEEPDEQDDPYTSEGGYTLQEFSEYELSDTGEQFGQMNEDDLPALLSDDSDDSDEEEEANVPPRQLDKPDDKKSRVKRRADRHAGLFQYCDDWPVEEFLDEQDIDKLAKEMASHIIWQGDTDEVEEFLFTTGERSSLSPKEAPLRKRNIYLRKSHTPQARPARTKAENFCLTGYVKVNGQQAFTLFDSGCTTDTCSPDFARVSRLKVFALESAIDLQLGTAGSRSKINYGTKVHIHYGTIQSDEYLDVVNLDRFDLVIEEKTRRRCRPWKKQQKWNVAMRHDTQLEQNDARTRARNLTRPCQSVRLKLNRRVASGRRGWGR